MAECGQIPEKLTEALATALVGDGVLNVEMVQAPCDELVPFITCDNNHTGIKKGQILLEVDFHVLLSTIGSRTHSNK